MGAGGLASERLLQELFLPAFDNVALQSLGDGAVVPMPPGRLVVATDAHVVSPIFFPGGDIGGLSVHGTVNDVAMMGARPLYLSASFILEEGFPLADLKRVVDSMAAACHEAGVSIVTGDTKVVEKGGADGVFITTTGVGMVEESVGIAPDRARPGDRVIVSGPIGEHGAAVLAQRRELGLETALTSDTQPLHGLVAAMLESGVELRCLRDPTRGGVASALNELARASGVGIALDEESIPVGGEVRGVCELLGLDPLYVACEGRLLAICPADGVERLLQNMRAHPKGEGAAIIGEVVEDRDRLLVLHAPWGGSRIVPMLTGEPLPRIC